MERQLAITGQQEQLRRYLADHRLTQRQLATRLNVPYRTINRWVQGHCRVSPAYRVWLKALKILET